MNLFAGAADGSGSPRRLTAETRRDIADFLWIDDEFILYFRDFDGDENFHPFRVSVQGGAGDAVDLCPFDGVKVDLIDEMRGDPDRVLIAMNRRDPRLFDAFRLHVRDGELEPAAVNPGRVTRWVADNGGIVRTGWENDGVNLRLLYRPDEESLFATALEADWSVRLDPVGYTFDDKRLVALSSMGRDTAAAVELDPATGEELAVLAGHPAYDLESVGRSHREKAWVGTTYTDWRLRRLWFGKAAASRRNGFRRLEERLPDMDLIIHGRDRDERIWTVESRSDREPGTFHLYDVEEGALRTLGRRYPDLDPDGLARTEPIAYEARDGLRIRGYLTLPASAEPRDLPLLVMPHGGPWYRDVWGYDPVVQFLADRGLAVLQPNFRGSTGYGKAFFEASFGQWGLAMQDDVTDGVRWLVGRGVADPARVAIFGGSYGGYAALCGLAFTPELYACGISYVGVSNLFTFLDSLPPYWEPFREMMYELIGHPERDRERLHATSPLFHVERIRAPLLVAQGARDPRVKQAESDQVVDALRARGVDVEYLLMKNEGHGFQREENRMAVFEAMERFLGRHLGLPVVEKEPVE